MTALSNVDIVQELRNETLVVSPILDSLQINASAIDLRMGNIILMARARGLSHVDPIDYLDKHEFGFKQGRHQKHERHEIPFKTRFLLHPGSLALVPTLEWVRLPLDLQGVVSARSSWAREGLSIATATFINPGYEGIITLELANLGSIPVAIYPGLRLAQMALYRLNSPAQKRTSRFDFSFEPKEGNIGDGDGAFMIKKRSSPT